MQSRVPGLRPPLRFDVIAGGRSNVTYRVTDADGGSWVLRRPPFGELLVTAHDMGREHRIVTALTSTEVPVASVVGLCVDQAVNGAAFYVMEFVDGTVIRNAEEGRALSPSVRMRASESLVDVLARIHAVNPDAVGLGDLGRKEAYIPRQLKRWYSQFEASDCSEVQLVHDLHAHLSAQVPEQGPAAVVHGDYRLDNCIVDEAGEVLAVLDWELCTLGDPLADLGLLLAYWSEPGDKFTALTGSPTQVEGFASRGQVLDRYAEASGRDLTHIDYYTAFGYWKVACIMAGIYTRHTGDTRGDGIDPEMFRTQVSSMAEMGSHVLEH